METHENLTSVTLHARDKEHAHRLVEAIFSDGTEAEEVVVPVVEKESFIKRLFMFLVKAVLFLVLTPFFLFTWLKNTFFLAIGFSIFYPIISFAYYSFFSNLVTTDEMMTATFTDTKFKILAAIVIVMGFLSALYDYQEKFEDITLL